MSLDFLDEVYDLSEEEIEALDTKIHDMCNDSCKGFLAREATGGGIDCHNCPINDLITAIEEREVD